MYDLSHRMLSSDNEDHDQYRQHASPDPCQIQCRSFLSLECESTIHLSGIQSSLFQMTMYHQSNHWNMQVHQKSLWFVHPVYSGKDMLYSSFDLLQSCNLCFWQDLPVAGKTRQAFVTSPASGRRSATCSYRHPWTCKAFLSSVFWSHRIWLSLFVLRIVPSGTSIQIQNVLSDTVCY